MMSNKEANIVMDVPNDTVKPQNGIKQRTKKIIDKLFFSEKSYLWLCFAIPVLIMYVIYLALDIHPFGDGSVLVLDLNAQYVYFYEALREFVVGEQSLLYSFCRQLGGEFMGIYAYYLASPLSYLVVLFPKGKILEALLTIFLTKTGLCGLTFGYYLHKRTSKDKRKKTTVIVFSIMYALCSYAVVHQSNSMWIDALVWLPILTFAIEELITKRKFKLFVISLAMTVMSNYYIGYMVCIYVALYFFYYYAAKSENSQNNLISEKMHFAKSLLRIIFYSAIAIGISAIIVLTAYYSLSFGKSDFTSPSWEIGLKADIMDYLIKFLPGSYDTVARSGLPFVYCGVLTLLMLPLYFISSKISIREKVMSGILISVFMASFMVNVVDLVWHGFQEPNWLNYRYSFMLSFLLLVFAYKGMEDMEATSGKVHLITSGFIVLFIVIAQKYTFKSFNSETGGTLDPLQTIAFTLVALAVYMVIFAAYKKAFNKKSIAIVMVLVVSLEMLLNGISNVAGFANDVVYSTYSSYNDFIDNIRPIVNKVQNTDKGFYRMEKINHRTTNDNMALNIRGLSNSSSTLNRETIELLRHLGYFSAYHKSQYYGGNPVNDSLLGVKYLIADNKVIGEFDDVELEHENTKALFERYYQLYASEGGYNSYYNPYALSIGFAASDEIFDLKFTNKDGEDINYDPYENTNQLISALLGSDDIIEVFSPQDDVDVALSNCKSDMVAGHYKYYSKDTESASKVIYTFKADRDGDIYFFVPSHYQRMVDITVNGKAYGTFYEDDTPRGFYIGYYEKGEKIKLEMTLSKGIAYVKDRTPLFYYLDQALFEDSMSTLAQTQVKIEDFTEDHLKGSIETSIDNQAIMTTIPYDEGWIVKVDGQEVEVKKTIDAFIGFEIDELGEHTVEFIYRSKAFVYGTICSVSFLTLFILLVVFEKKLYPFIYRKLYDEGNKDDDFGASEDDLAILLEAEMAAKNDTNNESLGG